MNHDYLMRGMSVQHLRFTVHPRESIIFSNQAGSALRGALYNVLSDNFCSEPNEPVTPDHQTRCPVCWLLAAEDAQGERGQDVQRPLTVEPPPDQHYPAKTSLSFGFSLIGAAQNLLPYIARAVQKMGNVGVGVGRGRFQLKGILEQSPLLDVERVLLEENVVKQPTLAVTPLSITETVARLSTQHITLEFLTPLRLIEQKQLVKIPQPVVFMKRLIERCQGLAERYAEVDEKPPREAWYQARQRLIAVAETVKIDADYTTWQEGWSGSRRQNHMTPLGGIVGTVRWQGDLAPLIPWLLWGQSLHVGKNAVKGNGWYRIVYRQ